MAKRQAELRRNLMEAITPLEIQALGKRLLKFANDGDMAAARLLCEYVLGKPKPVLEEGEDEAASLVIAPPEPLTGTA